MEEFSEQEEQTEEEKTESKGIIGKLKSLSKMQLIIIIVTVLLLFFSSIFVSFFIGDDEEKKKEKNGTEVEEFEVFETKFDTIIYFDQYKIDLNDLAPKRFLNMKISIEVADKKARETMDGKEVEVKEAVEELMEQKSFYDLRSVEGKLLLKKELIKKFNDIFGTGKVRNIYFNKFIMHKLDS